MQRTSTEDFYQRLTPIETFNACLDDAAYTPFPNDWTVLMSDVRDSTEAIANGEYKSVNMVGAATITAVLNACPGVDLPFVFGGDGGTIIVPPSLRRQSEKALHGLRAHCRDVFALDLRVGSIPVAELTAAAQPLLVCKYQLSPGNHLGFLSGPGHAYATDILKSPASEIDSLPPDMPMPELTGLSCRWEPLESQHGCILTLSVAPETTNAGKPIIPPAEVIAALTRILDGDMRSSAPARLANLRFKWPPKGLGIEAAAHAGLGGRVRAYMTALASSVGQLIAERLRIRMGDYDPKTYHAEMIANTDYRKLDGIVRLVLDVTPEQADAIDAYLEGQHRAGRLHYGVHRASAALMTCLVSSLADGRHIHFIDGADGGHTLAALDMKRRSHEATG